MDPTSVFVSNLANTCKGSSFIKENGKKLTIFERISDFFHGKHDYDHFKAVCEKLPRERLTDLSQDEQIEILGRIREIQSKINNNAVKQECEEYINRFESTVLTEENVQECSQAIFHDLFEKPNNRNLRKLDVLLNHYGNAPDSMEEILSHWKAHSGQRVPNKIVTKLLDKEEEVLAREGPLPTHSENYPILLRLSLERAYKNSNKRAFQERVSTLDTLMDSHRDDPIFIQNCLQEIDLLLKDTLFHPEGHKEKFLIFQNLFPVMNKHLPTIQNTPLAQNLKIKFGNLPTTEDRTAFPNLILSEKEQLDALVERLLIKEDELMDKLVVFLENNTLNLLDITRIAKCMGSNSILSDSNRVKLKDALEGRLNEIPEDWNNYLDVKDHLENEFLMNDTQSALIQNLYRTSKCKSFFENQLELDENMILIPRWYHATSRINIYAILNSGRIQVRHEQAYPGAWVSSKREESFGTHTIALSDKITALDPNAFIRIRFPDRRWRGLQRAIPISQDLGGVVIGVPANVSKTARKVDKLRLVKILKDQGFPDPRAMSTTQLDFMNNQVQEILGAPNLSNKWW